MSRHVPEWELATLAGRPATTITGHLPRRRLIGVIDLIERRPTSSDCALPRERTDLSSE
jgi:hypothetical protein